MPSPVYDTVAYLLSLERIRVCRGSAVDFCRPILWPPLCMLLTIFQSSRDWLPFSGTRQSGKMFVRLICEKNNTKKKRMEKEESPAKQKQQNQLARDVKINGPCPLKRGKARQQEKHWPRKTAQLSEFLLMRNNQKKKRKIRQNEAAKKKRGEQTVAHLMPPTWQRVNKLVIRVSECVYKKYTYRVCGTQNR